ncbi:MAG TPA: type II secretion system protein [Candidatus Saccharimonadales bacterium]|nr:type II secretion system protein [Candidatus Saccharimonadales bacterium]
MSAIETAVHTYRKSPRQARSAMRGFSLVELLVAMAMFLVISAAAFLLFNQHVKVATQQQSLSEVNIGLRNAMSQLQMDLAGAGQNLLSGVTSADGQPFSLGVIINNNVSGSAPACAPNTDWSYPVSSACFDSLTIINVKASCPVLTIDDPGNSQVSLSSSATMKANDPNYPGDNPTLASDATCFRDGDEVLILQLPASGQQQVQCDGGPFDYCMAVVTLTKDAQPTGNRILLQHNPTGATSDPLGIIFNASGATNFQKANSLTQDFNNGAYIIDLGDGTDDITYAVRTDPANASNPQLVRCKGASCNGTNAETLTDQVIGFKIGASLWNNAQVGSPDIASYFYNSANYCSDKIAGADCTNTPTANDPYDFSSIRSVRISMIARTVPNTTMALRNFTNGFDGGPYLVQQASIVVDLRNVSNPDSTN